MTPLDMLKTDIEVMVGGKGKLRTIVRALMFPNVRAVAYYRVGHWFAEHGMLPVAYLLRFRALSSTGADINPRALIGPYFCLMHTSGVVIGGDVVIGARVIVYQGVTMGTGKKPGMPYVSGGALISSGAKLLGGVYIEEDAVVKANAVVTSDKAW